MNERIRVLKHQASVWCDENISEQFSEETNGYGSAWEEKFAELIVRECVEQIIIRERADGECYQYDIFKYFGVEE